MSKDDEMILVVRRETFDEIGSFQGLNFDIEAYLATLISSSTNRFLRLGDAETDPSWKQLIPYAILTCNGRILHYVRGKKGGEDRLHALGSIGIGGHVNDEDTSGNGMDSKSYHAAVQRELNEELKIQTKYTEKIVALLNDDSNDVGKVHLGVVHVFELESEHINANEEEITELGFLTPEELKARHDQLESWSQICVESLEQILASASK